MEEPDAELESFREEWRKEVFARSKLKREGQSATEHAVTSKEPERTVRRLSKDPTGSNVQVDTEDEDFVPRQFHDLEDREQTLKIENESIRTRLKEREPSSALEHYEKAVEKETQGSLGDSVNLYRRAFKLDSRVHEAYKNKHFPPAALFPRKNKPLSTHAPSTVSESSSSVSELIEAFSVISIPPVLAENGAASIFPCPVASIPEEVLREIFLALAISDVARFTRLAQVCRRFAYLVMTEERIWKRLILGLEVGMAGMHYWYSCDLQGKPLLDATYESSYFPANVAAVLDLTPSVYPTYRNQFCMRPRIRFNGCYISTVNYSRPGASNQSQSNWNSPIHIVTYYRYLRFFRNGTVISLLTTSEPADVVHHLIKENVHSHHSGGLPSAVMKDALRGRWRLSGQPLPPCIDIWERENMERGPGEYVRENMDFEDTEGEVHVETEGVVPKYMWKMQFALTSAGRKDGAKNNKLNWKGFWSYNRLTDDWGEFGLKNDRAFYWSRVKSYGMGY